MLHGNDEDGDEVAAYIASFTPGRTIRNWTLIAALVRAVVLAAAPSSPRSAQEFLMILARFFDWAYTAHGLQPSAELLTPTWTALFLKVYAASRHPSTANQAQARLRDLISRWEQRADASFNRGGRRASRPYPPYAASEFPSLFSWASTRRLASSRRDANALLALGFGFGLNGAEISEVRAHQLDDQGDDGIVLELAGRSIWCDQHFEGDVRASLASADSDGSLTAFSSGQHIKLRLNHERRTPHHGGQVPILSRVRNTWFLRRATHIAPLLTILAAYGSSSPSVLRSLLPHFPTIDAQDDKHVLRTISERTH